MKKLKLLAVLCTSIIGGVIFQNFTLQKIFVKSPLPVNSYLPLSEMGGNGHALTWDGRVAIVTKTVSGNFFVKGAILSSHAPGFSLSTGQVLNVGGNALIMQGDGNLVLYRNGKPIFDTGTVGKCSACKFVYQGDGNLVIYNQTTKVAVWSSGTNKPEDSLAILQEAPYLGLVSSQGKINWLKDGGGQGWVAKVFRPETMRAIDTNSKPALEAGIRAAFSTDFSWAISKPADPAKLPGLEILDLNGLNALAISAAPGYTENPFRSDANGNESPTGGFETYKARVFTQYYGEPGNNPIGFFPVTIIVAQAKTATAQIHKIFSTGAYQNMKDVNGNLIHAIEPTSTFDGQLIVYQNWTGRDFNGDLFYTYHSSSSPTADGWSVPESITEMWKKPELVQKYPIARRYMKDANGTILTRLPGAYPWISLNGEDLMFSASVYKDGARRSGTSLVGASSKGLIRLMDGGINNARFGGFPRLFTSSPGRTPGMWSPMEFENKKVFPLTDKRFTYPVFSSNSSIYFETSYEESVEGNYEAFFDMTEVLTPLSVVPGLGNYDISRTQDVSGNFHVGIKSDKALYSEEAYASTCTNLECPMKVSGKMFSGQPMYFRGGGYFSAVANSSSGHTILKDANAVTLSLAVQPLISSGETVNLISKGSTFNLSLDPSLTLVVNFKLKSSTGVSTISLRGPRLAINDWNHLAVSLNLTSGAFTIYKDGVLTHSQTVASAGKVLDLGNDALIVGPSNSGINDIVMAMDQVGVSRIVRTHDEIRRQAGLIVNRMLKPSIALPSGLKVKDIRSDLIGRNVNENLKELGRHLFFDKRLSRTNTVSCASCHRPDKAFAESIALHDNLLARSGGPAKILRNTPSVLNAIFKSNFMADGRHAMLNNQAVDVLTNPEEMGKDVNAVIAKLNASQTYKALFANAFPNQSSITSSGVAAAVAEFQLSLVSGNSRFDQYMAGNLSALSDSERNGKALFFGKARCAECHSGSNFSDGAFHKLSFLSDKNGVGTQDLGRNRFTKNASDIGFFATPSLRNIASTGPYFHNGSVGSLSEAVTLYTNADPIDDSVTKIDLSSDEVSDLTSFLEALSGDVPRILEPVFYDSPAAIGSSQIFKANTQVLNPNQTMVFANTNLIMQGDGNLVVRDLKGKALWNSGSVVKDCNNLCFLAFQEDGNLVIYKGTTPIWSTGTFYGMNRGSKFLVSDSEPYLRVLTADGSIAWASSTSYEPGFTLKVGQFVQLGAVSSGLKLVLQGDGNLVLYRGDYDVKNAVWSTGTIIKTCGAGCRAVFQGDYNFVLYDSNSKSFWESRSYGHEVAKLVLSPLNPFVSVKGVNSSSTLWYAQVPLTPFQLKAGQYIRSHYDQVFAMQRDGNLVLYKANKPVWASNTHGYDCAVVSCVGVFQGDGNLVVYIGGAAKFDSATAGNEGATFSFNSSAPYLVIRNANGVVKWQR